MLLRSQRLHEVVHILNWVRIMIAVAVDVASRTDCDSCFLRLFSVAAHKQKQQQKLLTPVLVVALVDCVITADVTVVCVAVVVAVSVGVAVFLVPTVLHRIKQHKTTQQQASEF